MKKILIIFILIAIYRDKNYGSNCYLHLIILKLVRVLIIASFFGDKNYGFQTLVITKHLIILKLG